MRSTFWQNRISERQSSQNRHTGLKFSSRRNNSALSMKIVQNALFRSCAARFSQIAGQTSKNRYIVSNSRQNGKTVRFPWILYKTLFSGHAQHVLAKSHFWAAKVSQSSHWPDILSKNGKQYAFHEYCTKRSFQVMRSTFWPNRIIERQSSHNRHTRLKICFKTGKQRAFHENCTKRSFQVMGRTFWSNRICERQSIQNRHTGLKLSPKGNTVLFSWKFYITLFSGHAQHVLAKLHFCASKFSQSSHSPKICFKTGRQRAFHDNCTKPSFQIMRSTYWRNRIFERQSSQNRHTALKFSPKRENSALSIKIVQNAIFRSWAARFGQMAFVSVKVLTIVTLAWN